MTPDLQKQLERESKTYAQKRYTDLDGKKYLHRETMMYYAHLDGAKSYADKWQEAEERVKEIEQWAADLNLALAAMLNGYQNLSMYQKDWFTVPKDLIDAYTKMVTEYDEITPKTRGDE